MLAMCEITLTGKISSSLFPNHRGLGTLFFVAPWHMLRYSFAVVAPPDMVEGLARGDTVTVRGSCSPDSLRFLIHADSVDR